jgi:hypothetical protein
LALDGHRKHCSDASTDCVVGTGSLRGVARASAIHPYAFSPLPFDELGRFELVPWVRLGSDQNVALVSRALMFVPLGLLLAAWVAPQPRRPFELPALLVAGLLAGCYGR